LQRRAGDLARIGDVAVDAVEGAMQVDDAARIERRGIAWNCSVARCPV